VDSRQNSYATTLNIFDDNASATRAPKYPKYLSRLLETEIQSNTASTELHQGLSSTARLSCGRIRSVTVGTGNVLKVKPMPYSHNRQTSIVHGIQHSRHGSLASSSSGPLSPASVAAAGGSAPDAFKMARADSDASSPSPLSSLSGSFSLSSTATLIPERSAATADGSVNAITQKRVERMPSGKSRREHGHHHSQSRHHHKEEIKSVSIKTVSEYALHVLFTSFIKQAEVKISQCITVPLGPEPHIEAICGPGVDPTFDQLISALAHIASQKPKPLIDTLMFWRRGHSDAANEARSQFQQVRGPTCDLIICVDTVFRSSERPPR
jgi:hypothetical protein